MTWDQTSPFRYKGEFSTRGLSVTNIKQSSCKDTTSNYISMAKVVPEMDTTY